MLDTYINWPLVLYFRSVSVLYCGQLCMGRSVEFWNQLKFIRCEVMGNWSSFYDISSYELFYRNEF